MIEIKRIVLGRGFPRIFNDSTVQIMPRPFWTARGPNVEQKLDWGPAFPWDSKCRLVLEVEEEKP